MPDTGAVAGGDPAGIHRCVSGAAHAGPGTTCAGGQGRRDHARKPQPIAFHVNFAFNSAVLPDSAHEMIDLIAQLMKETASIKVRVEGHTDAAGSATYNVFLSERRALSVGEYLVQQGIDPSRLEVVGKGMAEPLTANRYDPPTGACSSRGSTEPWIPVSG